MKPHEKINDKGFTLIELMVVMVIGSMALAGIYGMYRAQMKSHVTQNAVVDVQQNLRSALYFLQRSIRMAGYIEPVNNPATGAGLMLDFSAYDGGSQFDNPSNATTGLNSIAFTLDANDSGIIGDDFFEIVAYRRNSDNELQVWQMVDDSIPAWEWVTIAENISNLEFTYIYANGETSDDTAIDAVTIATVRSIDIRIEAQVGQGNPMLDAEKTLKSVSARVKCRNLGLERSI